MNILESFGLCSTQPSKDLGFKTKKQSREQNLQKSTISYILKINNEKWRQN